MPSSNVLIVEARRTLARFFATLSMSENGCWEWQGALNNDGYGKFYWAGYRDKAHRFSYLYFKGDIPKGLVVMHSCDNRRCVNPEHLSVGTHQDNIQDAANKGRLWMQDPAKRAKAKLLFRDHPERIVRGEQHYKTPLTAQQVSEIRLRAASGETHVSISKDFPVTSRAISRIVRRETWRTVP